METKRPGRLPPAFFASKSTARTDWENEKEIPPFGRNGVFARRGTLAGAEGRAMAHERAWAHAEARGERRRHVSQGIAARGTELAADHVGAEPVAARFTIGINALHGGAGHVLHV
jgi:hypothetical protein